MSIENDCPKLVNVLNLLVGDNGTDPHCDLLDVLGASKNEILYIHDNSLFFYLFNFCLANSAICSGD